MATSRKCGTWISCFPYIDNSCSFDLFSQFVHLSTTRSKFWPLCSTHVVQHFQAGSAQFAILLLHFYGLSAAMVVMYWWCHTGCRIFLNKTVCFAASTACSWKWCEYIFFFLSFSMTMAVALQLLSAWHRPQLIPPPSPHQHPLCQPPPPLWSPALRSTLGCPPPYQSPVGYIQ